MHVLIDVSTNLRSWESLFPVRREIKSIPLARFYILGEQIYFYQHSRPGLDTIKQRRGLGTDKPVLLTGPGKIGQALGLSTDWSNNPLFSPGGLEVLDGPELEAESILVSARVGIDYALVEHVNALWRFAIAGSAWISGPKKTLRPP